MSCLRSEPAAPKEAGDVGDIAWRSQASGSERELREAGAERLCSHTEIHTLYGANWGLKYGRAEIRKKSAVAARRS